MVFFRIGRTTRLPLQQSRSPFPGLHTLIFALAVLLIAFTGCVSRGPAAQEHLDDASISRKLVGQWAGSASIYNPRSKSTETFHFRNKAPIATAHFLLLTGCSIQPGHFVREMGWGGTYVVTNGAVVCTITRSSEKEHLLPPKIETEPVVRLTENDMESSMEVGFELLRNVYRRNWEKPQTRIEIVRLRFAYVIGSILEAPWCLTKPPALCGSRD